MQTVQSYKAATMLGTLRYHFVRIFFFKHIFWSLVCTCEKRECVQAAGVGIKGSRRFL